MTKLFSHPDSQLGLEKDRKAIDLNELKKNCVISAVGKNSLHREWIKGNSDFDLHLIIYDDSYDEFCNDTAFVCCSKGYKLRLIYNYLLDNPEFLERYDYFFLPDDDILMDSENISAIFQTMEEYQLQIAQPALSDSYYCYEHTLRDKFCILHYTNFIEIMVPCFSRDALHKVLFTFDGNFSGWGAEMHWPHLIGFNGKEMAVLDQVRVVHTRPNQSFSMKNMNDLHEYLGKYNLKWEILQTGCVLKEQEEIKSNHFERFITDRALYKSLDKLVSDIAERFIEKIRYSSAFPVGLQGLAGGALFMAGYSKISEKRKYLDIALSALHKAGGDIIRIKDDLSFKSGLSGFTWCIEYFVQHGFIEEKSDEILEEICIHLNRMFHSEAAFSDLNLLIGISRHYIARMNNCHFDPDKELNRLEKNRLVEIVHAIHHFVKTPLAREETEETPFIAELVFILFHIKKVLILPEVDEALMLVDKAFRQYASEKELSLPENYALVLLLEHTHDLESVDKIIRQVSGYTNNFNGIGSQQMHDLYYLHKLYLRTRDDVFKNAALHILNLLVNRYEADPEIINELTNEEENPSGKEHLIELGIILVSILSDKDMEFDNCMF